MGFFDTYGKPADIKADKKQTTEEMIEHGIEQQEKLLNGETVLNAKGKSIRSWFRDGRFVPSVGIFGLFEGQAIAWKKGAEKAMLESFKKSFEAERELGNVEDIKRVFVDFQQHLYTEKVA